MIQTSSRMPAALAQTARRLAEVLENILQKKTGGFFHELLDWTNETFEKAIEPLEFADICAQTIACGMFACRMKTYPTMHPFLRKLFEYIESSDADEQILKIIADLAALPSDREDTTHFYENFLAAYNPDLRKTHGVFYTPLPAVKYIVRAIDAILQQEFNLRGGITDEVQIFDPATGTGTFLLEVIRYIHAHTAAQRHGEFIAPHNPLCVPVSPCEKKFLPHLIGFEVLIVPYLMALMKTALLLRDTGYQIEQEQSVNICLANSLSPTHRNPIASLLTDSPLIILGNPPYNVSTVNQSEYTKTLIAKYKEELKHETNIQPLSDDYIKFVALGQHLIETNPSGGILAYITNNSFLDGVIHWKMRKTLLETFDQIYILNLHGNTRKKETAPDGSKDESIFKIIQGTSINIFVRSPSVSPAVFYADLYGKSTEKLGLLETQTLETTGFTKITPKEPDYYFAPKDFTLKEEYDTGFGVNQLFIKYGTGIKFRKDNLLVKNFFSPQDVKTMLCDMAQMPDQQLLDKYKTKETKDWTLQEKRRYFLDYRNEDILPVLYRVFDSRWTYYPMDKISKIIVRSDARKDLMQHLLKENLVLLTLRNQPTVQEFDRVFIAKGIVEHCVIGRGTYAFPLYYCGKNNEKTLNLHEHIMSRIAERLNYIPAALKIFDYIYGVLHDPQYRVRYQEFLKTDFPRVPYPKDAAVFEQYVHKGTRLRKLHLLEEVPTIQTTFPMTGGNVIKNVRFADGNVFINETQYFKGVSTDVWNFPIGGYCPVQKYLKDRKGRVLSEEEIEHYQKIVAVLDFELAM